MSRSTIARTLAAVLAVPAFVLLQGYRDVRAELVQGGAVIDAGTRITGIASPSTAWPEALGGVVLAGALLVLVLPGHSPTLSRSLPLLVATSLLAIALIIGLAVTEPVGLQLFMLEEEPRRFWLWLRTGVVSPAVPALIGVLVVLCATTTRTTRRGRRPSDTDQR